MYEELINKQWERDELLMVGVYCLIGSFLLTPIFGIPGGIIAYFAFEDEAFKEKMKRRKQQHKDIN